MSAAARARVPAAATAGPAAISLAVGSEERVTLPDGRSYTVRLDPDTGHVLLDHRSSQAGADGLVLTIDIHIDLAPDGSFRRAVQQRIAAPSGEFQHELTTSSFDAGGLQLSEVTEGRLQTAARTRSERTVTDFAAGEPIRRTLRLQQVDLASGIGGERSRVELDIAATWDEHGAPLTDQSVPAIDRTERATYTSPGQGINVDTDRVITTVAHATGTPEALVHDRPMQLVVRFNGHGDEYVERELSVPIVDGEPVMSQAVVVRSDDHQAALTKGMTQARIWGGFVSGWMAVIGLNMRNGSLKGLGRGLMYGGVAAGLSEVAGEGHAMLTRRNDASGSRLFMSIYDTTWTGLLTYATRRRSLGARAQLAANIAGIGSASIASARLGSDLAGRSGLGTLLASGARGTARGAIDASRQLFAYSDSPFGDDWRAVPRVDLVSSVV